MKHTVVNDSNAVARFAYAPVLARLPSRPVSANATSGVTAKERQSMILFGATSRTSRRPSRRGAAPLLR